MSDEIPQWAFDRMRELYVDIDGMAVSFARYIMQHEKPPVDKDVLMMRDILASQWDKGTPLYEEILRGDEDDMDYFQDALAAYRKHKR